MNPGSIVVHQAPGRPARLILLFHGVGATADGLVPLGRLIGSAVPDSTVVSVAAPNPSFNPGGREWFSVAGVTEANRPGRVEQALPSFLAEVRSWQESTGVDAVGTTLVGFSQGAIMSLEAGLTAASPAAGIVAIAGRFARLPERAPADVAMHFIHGRDDGIIACEHAIDAAQRLRSFGATVTLDVVPNAGHEINRRMAELAVERLQGGVAESARPAA